MKITGVLAYRTEVPFEIKLGDPEVLDDIRDVAMAADEALLGRPHPDLREPSQVRILDVDGDEDHAAALEGWRYVE